MNLELDQELVRHERDNRALIDDQVKLSAYRIVEEAMGNSLKHSKASTVALRLDVTDDRRLRISVRDNGCGFDVASDNKSLGIFSIIDYAELVGGVGAVHSTPGHGTEVVATLPFEGTGEA